MQKAEKYVKRFFVVKTSKEAQWTLLLEKTMSRAFVNPSWNLELAGVSDPPGVAESQRPLGESRLIPSGISGCNGFSY